LFCWDIASQALFRRKNRYDIIQFRDKKKWQRNFGLDIEDAKDNQLGAGFRAWFRLQRARGYKPLLTVMTIEHTFSGSFNANKSD
jgi:hypothetical protein